MKSFKSAYVALSLLGVLILAGNALAASPLISLKPGDSLTREFVLFDEIDFRKLGPAQLFLVIGTGDNVTKLGDLSIAVKSYVPTEELGTDIDYTVRGISMPLAAGATPTSISMVSTVPVGSTFPAVAVTKTVKINSVYGLALVVIYISNFDGDTYGEPARFSVTFGMTAAAK